jgi:hydroxymethylglutaryl-CoA lyase
VLMLLNPPRSVEIIAIVVNTKGAERAIQTGSVTTLGFPHSISPEFLRRNQSQTTDESLATLQSIVDSAREASLYVVAYLSMAFGNPYGDPWSIDQVISASQSIISLGVRQLSLADTVGLAAPQQIAETFSAVRTAIASEIELGVHLHARPESAAEKIRAAYLAGCRRFDTSLGGFGGCPFAQDALVGNIATETARAELARLGAELPSIATTDNLIAQAQSIHTSYAHA